MIAWMRILEVRLTSRKHKKQISFGMNEKQNLSIDIHGYKYMSTLKDEFVINIRNLTYAQIVELIHGEYYDVEIICGYKSSSAMTIFKGGVLYVSNNVDSTKTSTTTILCASEMIARYGQKRLNLTMNSGVNMYSALNFICKRAGIANPNISTQFKKKFTTEPMNVQDTAASWIEQLCAGNGTFISNSDSSVGSAMTLFNAAKSNNRIITLKEDNIILNNYPTLTSDGLRLTVQPTFNFMCGDTIKIDNSIIQIPVRDKSEISKNYGYFLDEDGMYMIYQMTIALQNRGHDFSIELLCKTRSLISKLTGGNNE